MADLLPSNFPLLASNIIQSFNFSDVAQQTGYIRFYGFLDEDTYKLTSNTFYSNKISTVTTSNANSDTVQHDKDFDVKFESPQDMRGELVVSVPVGIRNTAGSAQSYNIYTKIYVRKWDGVTETEIANDTGATIAWGGTTTANGAKERMFTTVSVTVPITHFKAGEYLRVTVEVHGWNGGAASEYYIGHDPANRATDIHDTLAGSGWTWDTHPSTLLVDVPFRVIQ